MKIACIYWYTSSVGGIATHLNSIRTAAIDYGDQFDILHSRNWATKSPRKFPRREWIRGGDTRIWIDGEVPQTREAAKWLESNYDALYFGFICPHPTKAYPNPDFLPLYDVDLPKVAGITDGYWEEYKEWGKLCVSKVQSLVAVQPSYADVVIGEGLKVEVLLAPFVPSKGQVAPRSKDPLLIWPCQWKNIKGITQFIDIVPELDPKIKVDMYSNGIRYYQIRTEDRWKAAVGKDLFQSYNGDGRATFHGNVDMPEVVKAYQRAWFTVNLQGMNSRKVAYQRGSYNFTEVEALWYGACPILHESTLQTPLPKESYIAVASASDIPTAIDYDFALCPKRQAIGREYIREHHLASSHYKRLRGLFG